MSRSKLTAAGLAALLVLSVFASMPVAAQEESVSVETNAASDVTNDSATLNGELTGLGGADSAEVWFEWWEQGDSANATAVGSDTLDEPGSFSADLTGLNNDTTYVFVAHAAANNTTVAGDEVEFTTGADGDQATNRTWDGEGAFGQWVTSWLKNLIDPGNNTILGQTVSEIVTANNPGSEHRSDKANPGGNSSGPPEHAGPPDDEGNESERGPPEDAGPSDDANSTDDGDDSGPPEDAGPPEDKGNESEDNGPPEDADSPDDDGNETERGPPDHADDEDEDDEADEEDEGAEDDEADDENGDDEADEEDEDAEDDEADDENGDDEADEADGEEEADDGQDSGEDDGNGPPDDRGPDNDNGQGNR